MKRRILIVEDYSDMRALYRAMFRKDADIEIVEAETGEQALERLAESKPDLMIVDISLPGINGIELTKKVACAYPGLRILIVTGHQPERYRELAVSSGANDLVSKNSAREIMAAVRRLLPERRPVTD